MAFYSLYTVALRRGSSQVAPAAVTIAATTSLWGAALLTPWLLLDISVAGLRVPSPLGWAMILVLAVALTAPAAGMFAFGAERLAEWML
jgi:drug/metabolite transporter (DMT)-like permease